MTDTPATALTETFQAPNGRIAWTRIGEGPAVVLMHGTPFSSAVWRDIATALAPHHTVYLWDMPGYGRSQMHPDQDVSLAAQQQAFTRLLQHWDLDAPAVVAHDFGGAVALRSALLDGASYSRLALVDAVSLRPWGSDLFRLVADNPGVFSALPAPMHRALVEAYIASAAHRPLRAADAAELADPWLGATGQSAFYRQIAQADERHTAQIEGDLHRLPMPVTVLWGQNDTWLAPATGHRLARAIGHARLHTVPGAGHLIQHDAPAQLTALITEFLHR
ncbi:alpha/beta fold hydrolase [Streptomonospora wellingtoniae]|uniref:Alpha/beta fold hydrolase n=1 Tax=Streptomonospora wellingtoniae TaxID=3075544 RepID=A0ABU2KX36_9ACTN|nr:alpha/beta fold hydrolase [Streptomonospora sp. DSM 45055]MDT0303727.1 alpha/beta fold hydrolase [Streptomonospora sp. DSM 45055]